ncbi:hypothetical protein YC2023_112285 [Brassica napus]
MVEAFRFFDQTLNDLALKGCVKTRIVPAKSYKMESFYGPKNIENYKYRRGLLLKISWQDQHISSQTKQGGRIGETGDSFL